MTINQLRKKLYVIGKILGDIQALTSSKKGSVQRRIKRRILGKIFGRLMK